jgi:glyoxylase-like metal-dependent hydrolase (beta-lactamase superfamily II)
MQVAEHLHALRIPFKIPLSPEKMLDRAVYSYIVFGDSITLIDSGVAGAETILFDYLKKHGRDPQEISTVILSHSHPDHIGSVMAVKEATQCKIFAHSGEKDWIEDTEKQFQERPVPGFHTLVRGPVAVDRLLADGETVDLGAGMRCEVLHTPGHSRGSLAFIFENEKVMITGDALPLPGDLPIYDDIVASVQSIKRLQRVKNIETLLSSWEAPVYGYEHIAKRIADGLLYLRRIHEAVSKGKGQGKDDLSDLCRHVVHGLGLPPFAANPLVARSFAANLAAMNMDIFR